MDRTYARHAVGATWRGRERPAVARTDLRVRGRRVQDDGVSQFASSQARSASRASLRRRERAEHRPADGPEVGVPAAVAVGLDVAGAGDRRGGRARPGRSPRRRSPARGRGRRSTSCITPPPARPPAAGCAAGAARPASRPATTGPARAGAATRWRSAWLSRRSWAPTPRTARWARSTSSSSCSLRADVQLAEPAEEVRQVVHGRVAEDPAAGRPRPTPVIALAQVGDQPGELLQERLLGQLHRLLEPRRHAGPLLLVDGRAELPQVVGRLDAGEVPRTSNRPTSVSGSRPG